MTEGISLGRKTGDLSEYNLNINVSKTTQEILGSEENKEEKEPRSGLDNSDNFSASSTSGNKKIEKTEEVFVPSEIKKVEDLFQTTQQIMAEWEISIDKARIAIKTAKIYKESGKDGATKKMEIALEKIREANTARTEAQQKYKEAISSMIDLLEKVKKDIEKYKSSDPRIKTLKETYDKLNAKLSEIKQKHDLMILETTELQKLIR